MSTLPLLQKPPYQILVSPRGLAVLVQHMLANVTSVIRVARDGTQGPLSILFKWYRSTWPTFGIVDSACEWQKICSCVCEIWGRSYPSLSIFVIKCPGRVSSHKIPTFQRNHTSKSSSKHFFRFVSYFFSFHN